MTAPIQWGGQHIGQFTNLEAYIRGGIVGVRRVLAVLLNVPTNNTNTDVPFTLGAITTYAGQTNNSTTLTLAGTVLTQGLLGPAGYSGTVNYNVRDLQLNNSILSITGATASNSTTTFGLFTAAAAGGTTIVTAASLTLGSNTATALATIVASFGGTQLTNTANNTLYLRTGTASGVTSSQIDMYLWGEVLP